MLSTGAAAPATKPEPSCHCPARVELEMGWDCHSGCLLLLLCPSSASLQCLHWEIACSRGYSAANRGRGKNGKQLLLLSLEVPNWDELMGNRHLGMNGLCRGQQEGEEAGSSPDSLHLRSLVPVGWELAVLLLQLCEARSAKWGGGGEGGS